MKKFEQESEILNALYSLGIKKVSLPYLKMETKREIVSAIQDVAKEFPCICDRIASISVALPPFVSWGSEAETILEPDLTIHIRLNARFFLMPKRFKRTLDEEKHTQYAAGIGIKGVVAHELGHVLHFLLEIKRFYDVLSPFDPRQFVDTKPIIDEVRQMLGVTSRQMKYYLSAYGSQDSDEALAECVSEYFTTASPRMFSRLVISKLKNKF